MTNKLLAILSSSLLFSVPLCAPAATPPLQNQNSSPPLSCTLTTSNASPTVGMTITLTANCNANPTSFAWTGCASTTRTCSTTSQTAGTVSYAVTASNASRAGSASLNVNWQAAPPITCTLTTSNASPTVGTTITLTANCNGSPTSYAWTGCTSTTNTCSTTSQTAGTVTYMLTARNASSTGSASINVNWQAARPTSADFLPKQPDPRASMPYGGDAAYVPMHRITSGAFKGLMVMFGMSHTPSENNAVVTYDPVTDSYAVRIPHTVASWPSGGDVSGRTFLGNRDNQSHIMVSARNELWVFPGQRGYDMTGNIAGVVDTSTWTWKNISDTWSLPQVSSLGPTGWDAAAGFIEALNVGFVFGPTANPNDMLVRFDSNPSATPPFNTMVWSDVWGNPSFSGSEKLAFISGSWTVRNSKVYVYAGLHEDRAGVRTNSRVLYEIDVMAPSMTVYSVNNLPDGQRVDGPSVLADRNPVKDMLVVTNGTNVNVFDFVSRTWSSVPVNQPDDPARHSPNGQGGNHQGQWSPETNQYIFTGSSFTMWGLKLNY
jgi:hypothetical protein